MPTVSELRCYPVKGCAGVSVSSAVVTATGLAHDRTFLVTGGDGMFRTQRDTPALARVRPEVRHDGVKLALSTPDTDGIVVDVDTEGPRRTVTVHRWRGDAIDQGDDAADWLSEVLGEPVRLVRVPPEHSRSNDELHGPITFADSTPIHLTALSSLDDLNARLLERGAEPLPMDRFRPNIVVGGWPEPYTEDAVRRLRAGTAEFGFVKMDIRCVVTTTDQERGVRAGPEPLRTLADYRREPDGGVSFGIKANVARTGELAVGDPVTTEP